MFLALLIPNIKTNNIIYLVTDLAYSDLTEKFPVQSSRGNNYVLVTYYPDSNSILVTPFKNQTAQEIVNGWQKIFDQFKLLANTPNYWILDNEYSESLK